MIRSFLKYQLRTGSQFQRYLEECSRLERCSLDEVQEYQNKRLHKVLEMAYASVPFYRKKFDELHLKPSDIKGVADLQKLPVIDKSIVRSNYRDFKNTRFVGLAFRGHTGGTTGAPGVFLRDANSISFENAALWRQYMWAGKQFRSRRATIRGMVVAPVTRMHPPFWKYNAVENELILSSFHMSDENLRYYVEEIQRFQPYDLYAYPSTAYVLANYCKRKNLNLKFGCVFTSSEMVLDYQKEEIEKVFGCRIFDWYGSGERVAAIGQCEHGTYHEIPHYSVIEYIPLGENKYEVVGTTLHNEVMPLIRYKVGDIVELKEGLSCACGRPFREISTIIGRDEDLLYFEDGRRARVIVNHIFQGLNNVREAQIIQDSMHSIRVRVVPENPGKEIAGQTIVERMVKALGGPAKVYRVEIVDHIERGRNGKYKFVENHMLHSGLPQATEAPRPRAESPTSPLWLIRDTSSVLKNLVRNRLRTGSRFRTYLKECARAEQYSPAEVQEYQNERLRRVIVMAYTSVPYYRDMFNELGLKPADIMTVADLKKLPTLDKTLVREHYSRLRNRRFMGLAFKGHTGGTTGAPGVFLRDANSISFENAALWRQYLWAGKQFNSRRATIRGTVVAPLTRMHPPFWKHNAVENELILSSFHMSDENLWYYVEEIQRFQPYDLYAYPSTAYVLANYCKRKNLNLKFGCVFTSSEMVLDYQKEEIEKVFGCRIFDWYGSGERVAAIGQCEHGTYHEIPHYSVIEYIPLGENKYEVVGTTLHNEVMPLIRYKVGDIVELKEGLSCACGRPFREISTIIGRDEDLLYFEDGRRSMVMESRVFAGMNNVREAQIIQHDLSSILIKVVPENPAKGIDTRLIVDRMTEHVGGQHHNYQVQLVESIERGRNGKYKFVENHLARMS